MTCIGQPLTLLRALMCLGLLGSLCASVAAQPLLPPGTYASGGISSEGRAEMRAIRNLYNLHLAFAQAGTGGAGPRSSAPTLSSQCSAAINTWSPV